MENEVSERRNGEDRRRDVFSETNQEQTGMGLAVSSHAALYYHLISPYTIKRLAERKTGGGVKYGWVQWRQGINDIEYVTDRYNHLWEHLLKFQEEGNEKDDNLGAMLWALDCLIEIERLCPEVLKQVIGTCKLFGKSAEQYHLDETPRREARKARFTK